MTTFTPRMNRAELFRWILVTQPLLTNAEAEAQADKIGQTDDDVFAVDYAIVSAEQPRQPTVQSPEGPRQALPHPQ